MIDVRRYSFSSFEDSQKGFLIIKNGRGFFISMDEAKTLLKILENLLREDRVAP